MRSHYVYAECILLRDTFRLSWYNILIARIVCIIKNPSWVFCRARRPFCRSISLVHAIAVWNFLFSDSNRIWKRTDRLLGFENEECGLQMSQRRTLEINNMASRRQTIYVESQRWFAIDLDGASIKANKCHASTRWESISSLFDSLWSSYNSVIGYVRQHFSYHI